jgi:hypothetical protein
LTARYAFVISRFSACFVLSTYDFVLARLVRLAVVAEDSEAGILIVVTAYEPDPIQWDAGFKRKVL